MHNLNEALSDVGEVNPSYVFLLFRQQFFQKFLEHEQCPPQPTQDKQLPSPSALKQQRRRLWKRHLKIEVDRATSNLIVLIPSHSIHEMLVIFSGVKF